MHLERKWEVYGFISYIRIIEILLSKKQHANVNDRAKKVPIIQIIPGETLLFEVDFILRKKCYSFLRCHYEER